MGIHNFQKWIKNNFKDCYKSIEQKIFIDHFYIDINFCLHNVVYNTTKPDILIKKMCAFIDNLLKKIEPKKSITFALDGPAPYAKLILQRSRRLTISRTIDNFKTDEINQLSFTPGTKFMLEINNKMKDYLLNLKNKFKINIIELFNGPDESELKIIKQVINNNKLYPLDTHLIFSNDADVIIMSTILSCYDKMYVAIKSKENINIFNINKFANILKDNNIFNNYNYDLAFILLFMGNDYLPKLLNISFENIIKSYKQVLICKKYGLSNKDLSININFLKDFMLNLTLNYKNFNLIKSPGLINYNEKQCKNYLEGILWCVNCYRTGICNKYDYMYKYKKSPYPLEILYYLIFNNNLDNLDLKPFPTPIPDYIYALLVLPKKAKNLIDIKYHKLLNNKLKILYEEEDCLICSELYDKLSDLNKTKNYIITMNENYDNIKAKYLNLTYKIKKHKIIHKNIDHKDINYIIKLLKK